MRITNEINWDSLKFVSHKLNMKLYRQEIRDL